MHTVGAGATIGGAQGAQSCSWQHGFGTGWCLRAALGSKVVASVSQVSHMSHPVERGAVERGSVVATNLLRCQFASWGRINQNQPDVAFRPDHAPKHGCYTSMHLFRRRPGVQAARQRTASGCGIIHMHVPHLRGDIVELAVAGGRLQWRAGFSKPWIAHGCLPPAACRSCRLLALRCAHMGLHAAQWAQWRLAMP